MPFLILAARIGRAARRVPLIVGLATCALVAGAEGASAASPLRLTGQILGPPTAQAQFSSSSGPAGDVNGDGLDDVVARVLNHFVVVLGTRDAAGPRLPELGGAGYELGTPNTFVESRAVPAGDVDGDGFDDLVVPAGIDAYLVYGAAQSGNVDVAVPQSRVTKLELGQASGTSDIVGVGDFDGDGFDDLATKAGTGAAVLRGGPRVATLSATSSGSRRLQITGIRTCYFRAFIIYTCDTMLKAPQPAGDVNGDGKDDLYMPDRRFILLGRTGTTTVAGNGPDSRSFNTKGVGGIAGQFRPGGVGDVTGDGIDDLVAAPNSSEGAWHVIPGRTGTSGTLDVAGAGVVKITKPAGAETPVVTSAGDLDGDGRIDLAATIDDEVRIVNGRAGAATVALGGIAPLVLPIGDLAIDTEYESASLKPQGAGDLDGDGEQDLTIASPRSDTDGIANRGTIFVLTHGADRLAPALHPRGTSNPEVGSNVTPSVFAAAPTGTGTTIRVNLLEPATVEVKIQRPGGPILSSETRAGLPEGVTTIGWDGRGRGVDGAPGKYELVLVAIDAAGNRSAPQAIPFEVSGEASATPPTLQATRRVVVPANPKVRPPLDDYPNGSPDLRRVMGECPDSAFSLKLTETPQDIALNDPRAGDPCALTYQPPPAQDVYGEPALSTDPAKFPWKTTVRINGGAPVAINASQNNAYVGLPRFALRNGVNTVEIVDTWDDSGLVVNESDVTDALQWQFPAPGGGIPNIATGDPRTPAGLQLTPASANQIGVAAACPAGLSANAMTVDFDAEITGGSGAGHGMAFVVFDSRPATILKSGANVGFGWVGYSGTAFAIVTAKERYNPSNNFFGIASGVPGKSGYPTWLTSAAGYRPFAGRTTHVTVRVKDGTAEFTADGQQIRRAVSFPAGACIGFTAATGTRTQKHVVKNLRVRSEA